MTDQEQRYTTTRRGMLGVATVGLGAAIGGVLATPVAAYLLAPVTQEATFHPVSLGPVRSFTSETGFAPTAAPYVDDSTPAPCSWSSQTAAPTSAAPPRPRQSVSRAPATGANSTSAAPA